MTLDNIKDVQTEIVRFNKRMKAALKRVEEDKYALYGCKETGALKRAAADLKTELTKLIK